MRVRSRSGRSGSFRRASGRTGPGADADACRSRPAARSPPRPRLPEHGTRRGRAGGRVRAPLPAHLRHGAIPSDTARLRWTHAAALDGARLSPPAGGTGRARSIAVAPGADERSVPAPPVPLVRLYGFARRARTRPSGRPGSPAGPRVRAPRPPAGRVPPTVDPGPPPPPPPSPCSPVRSWLPVGDRRPVPVRPPRGRSSWTRPTASPSHPLRAAGRPHLAQLRPLRPGPAPSRAPSASSPRRSRSR